MLKKYKTAVWYQYWHILAVLALCIYIVLERVIEYNTIHHVVNRRYELFMSLMLGAIILFTFGKTFRLMMGMGVSRKTTFASQLTVIILVGLLFSAFRTLDFIIELRLDLIKYRDLYNAHKSSTSFMTELYIGSKKEYVYSLETLDVIARDMFLWCFSMIMMYAAIAYAVRIFIYGLSSKGKKRFFASLAAIVIFVPSSLYLLSRKTDAISKAISYLLLEDALRSSVSFTVIAIIMFTTAYLLIRRAPLKYKEE